MSYILTSESVNIGHPDKICDVISDSILDTVLRQDPNAHVAIECSVKGYVLFLFGEIRTSASVDYKQIARGTLNYIGYNGDQFEIIQLISGQSAEINKAVSDGKETGAGDQGCIKKGTLISTKRGFVPIEHVIVGDEILTSQGYKKCYHVQKTGTLPTIKLTTNLGRELYLTPDHKIFTIEEGWVEAQNSLGYTLNTDSYNVSNKNSTWYTLMKYDNWHGGKLTANNKTLILDKNLAYLMGFLIGDGCITSEKKFTFACHMPDKINAIKNKIISCFPEATVTEFPNGITVNSVLYRKALYKLGLGYWKSNTKQIPYSILENSLEIQRAFLKGYFDADGTAVVYSKDNGTLVAKVSVASVSMTLLQQTSLLLRNNGINCYLGINGVSTNPKIPSNYMSYRINIRGYESYVLFNEIIGFDVQHKKEKLEYYINNHYSTRKIPKTETVVSIEKADTYDVYDLSIEEVPEFYANGILVHNCIWGYACNETKELMPLPIMIAHELMKVYDIYRRNINTKYKPDAKSQVSVIYSKDKPIGISNIIVSVSHEKGLNIETIKQDIQENVIIPALKKFDYLNLSTKETTYMINPGGEFTSYGSEADGGTTGRKIAVDTYGSLGKFGGGALSSKDPTKVDRSGAYYARYVAKNVVAAGLADKCEIQVSYAIGQPKPTSIYINCFGTNTLEMPQIYKWVNGLFDFSVDNMINELNLRRPIYRKTACYGHFGREEFPWEKIK